MSSIQCRQHTLQLMSFQNLTRIQLAAFCHKTKLPSHAPVCSNSSSHMVPDKRGKLDGDLEGRHANHQNRLWSRYNTTFAVKQTRKIEGHRENVRKPPSVDGKL